MSIFKRSKLNPILKPIKENNWESLKVYNPGAIYENGKYYLFYRAVGNEKNWKSSIGYAVSEDGEKFTRFNKPVLSPKSKEEKRGVEDPRITRIDDTYYMVYAAYDGITPRLSIATSKDLKTWEKRGFAFSDWSFEKAGGVCISFDDYSGKPFVKPNPSEWSKSGGIFSEIIDGKFWMLFGEFRIWFATSDDGINWAGDQEPFLNPRQGDYFDNTFVEMGPPPIKTERGWLVLYHGINNKNCYRIGFLLLDLKNPRKIIYRSDEPIFGPEKNYEMSGIVDYLPGGFESMEIMGKEELDIFIKKAEKNKTMPKVTFCCGAVVVDGLLKIYYGAGDTFICTATAKLDDILNSK